MDSVLGLLPCKTDPPHSFSFSLQQNFLMAQKSGNPSQEAGGRRDLGELQLCLQIRKVVHMRKANHVVRSEAFMLPVTWQNLRHQIQHQPLCTPRSLSHRRCARLGLRKSLLTCDFKSKWVLLVSFWISLSCSHTGTSKCMFAHFSEREVRSLSTPKLAIIISTPTLAFVLLWRDFSHDE